MRRSLFILILISALPAGICAQTLSSFSNQIFKPVEQPVVKEAQLEISDFKYQSPFEENQSSSLLDLPRTNPGVAFLSSALIPGSGQAINGKWVRAGVYFAVEALGIIYHLDRNATARRQEKAYEAFTHEHWSVVAYAQWIVEYSDANNLSQPMLDELRNMVYSNGRPIAPTWGNTPADWNKVSISTLHAVENRTPFIFDSPDGCWNNSPRDCRRGSAFSHTLPEYGSQQYYELISKYYQFQSGWRDFYDVTINMDSPTYNPNHTFVYGWLGADEPNAFFYQGRDRAQEFNDNYRAAGNILKLLLVNHVVSAFDALFTVQLKNSRIETNTNLMKAEQFSLTWHF